MDLKTITGLQQGRQREQKSDYFFAREQLIRATTRSPVTSHASLPTPLAEILLLRPLSECEFTRIPGFSLLRPQPFVMARPFVRPSFLLRPAPLAKILLFRPQSSVACEPFLCPVPLLRPTVLRCGVPLCATNPLGGDFIVAASVDMRVRSPAQVSNVAASVLCCGPPLFAAHPLLRPNPLCSPVYSCGPPLFVEIFIVGPQSECAFTRGVARRLGVFRLKVKEMTQGSACADRIGDTLVIGLKHWKNRHFRGVAPVMSCASLSTPLAEILLLRPQSECAVTRGVRRRLVVFRLKVNEMTPE